MHPEKFGEEFAGQFRKFWTQKKPLKILGLLRAINFVACLKSPLLYQLS